MTESKVLQFQNRPATKSAGKNRDDGTHMLKHAGDTTAARPKTLDFSAFSEFSVGTEAPAGKINRILTTLHGLFDLDPVEIESRRAVIDQRIGVILTL